MAAATLPNKPIPNKIGDRFGKITIIAPAASLDKRNKTAWLCRCECGVEKVIRQTHLRSGVKSCGCVRKENLLKISTKHGGYKSLTYASWYAMKQRCTYPKHKKYSAYGGRGIKVCERWLHSFENFLADMGERVSKEYTLDRKNPDGDYEPENCQWTTWKYQQRNKRDTRFFTLHGQTKSLVEWCEIYNIKLYVVSNRVKLDWDFEKALTEPVQRKPSK